MAQNHSAMPVTTDACVFAATCEFENATHLLDIGTGTGLLTLMLAQKYPTSKFTAIEIDETEYLNAKNNFDQSPWKNNIEIIHTDLKYWDNPKNFDGIVCNPPFFDQQFQSSDAHYNRARHQITLTFENLIESLKKLLKPTGLAYCLIPALHLKNFEEMLLNSELNIGKVLGFSDKPSATPHVFNVQISSQTLFKQTSILIYKNEDGQYSKEFEQLLSNYYSKL